MAPPSVYMSNDGGYTWLKPAQLKDGPHFYGILDSGGVVYAIPMSNDPQNTIWYVSVNVKFEICQELSLVNINLVYVFCS